MHLSPSNVRSTQYIDSEIPRFLRRVTSFLLFITVTVSFHINQPTELSSLDKLIMWTFIYYVSKLI